MEYKIEKLPKSELEIRVIIPFLELEPYLKKAAVLISEKTKFDGFRQGKAPYDVVKNKVGELAIYEEAAELAVRKNYLEILAEVKEQFKKDEKEFMPIGRPEITITKLALGNELEYKMRFALLPEIVLPDYKKIAGSVVSKNKKPITVKMVEVDKTIEWIRESRAPSVAVDRTVQKGDFVEIDFEVRQDGVKIENGESHNHPLTIGRSKFLPGFEDQIIGMKAGEEKTFALVVPEDWPEKSLAGRALEFKTALKSVQEKQLPELNDEFAKGLGNFSSVDALRMSVEEGLRQEKEEKEKQRVRMLIIEEVARTSRVEIPEILVHRELEKMLAELKAGAEQMGMKWEDYLSHVKKTPEELKKEWAGEAEKRARIALCLREIGRLEKIEPNPQEIEGRIKQFLAQYKNAQEAEKGIDPEDLKEYSRGILRNEKVFEFLEVV